MYNRHKKPEYEEGFLGKALIVMCIVSLVLVSTDILSKGSIPECARRAISPQKGSARTVYSRDLFPGLRINLCNLPETWWER